MHDAVFLFVSMVLDAPPSIIERPVFDLWSACVPDLSGSHCGQSMVSETRKTRDFAHESSGGMFGFIDD